MTPDLFNVLAMLCIKRKLVKDISDFNKKVIESFAARKARRVNSPTNTLSEKHSCSKTFLFSPYCFCFLVHSVPHFHLFSYFMEASICFLHLICSITMDMLYSFDHKVVPLNKVTEFVSVQ